MLAVVLFLAWLILAPYMSALVLAGTLAFLFRPLYQKCLHVFRYESVAALSVVVIVTLIIFLPLGFLGVRLFTDATALYSLLASHGGFDPGTTIANFLNAHFKNLPVHEVAANFNGYAQQGLAWLIQHLGSFFSGVAQIFLTAFLSLLGLFYFLKDGERRKKWIFETIPLAPKYTERIVREMGVAGSSVIKGTLIVAIAQGIVLGVGFLLFNVPDPTFWGVLAVPASIIPVVGTWLVAVPAIAYLFLTGQTVVGICLLVWSLICINLIYNVFSPQLMHRSVDIHPYLILLSILGGIGLFGPIGFLVGPLAIAALFSLFKIYSGLTPGHD